MDGSLLYTYGGTVESCYGSAFDNASIGQPYLWTFDQTTSGTGAMIRQYAISYSPYSLTPTGVTFNVQTVPGASAGMAGGMCSGGVTTKFALMCDVQLDPQFVCALELTDNYVPPGPTPEGLIGYKVYRDNNYLAYIGDPDTLWYYDFTVYPGQHTYEVSAYYDLTDYGFPGQFDESLLEGPVDINIVCGRPLPFCEHWDAGSFGYNDWTFAPAQGNWQMNTGVGNPAPAADFSWIPLTVDYSYSLESPVLNAGPWNCSTLWLDFDVKLEDRFATGEEKLLVEGLWGGNWHDITEFANNGSFDWDSQHIDITEGVGSAVKLRFTAYGENTEDILHWYVDNICVYGICNPPTNLSATEYGWDIDLEWNSPSCYTPSGGTPTDFIYDDDSWEDGLRYNAGFVGWVGNLFPLDAALTGTMESIDVYFVDNGSGSPQNYIIEMFNSAQVSTGVSAPFSGSAPDLWINVPLPSIPFTGPVYVMVKYDATPGNGYFVACDTDGPYVSQFLAYMYDGTTFTNPSYWPGGAVFFVRGHGIVFNDDGDAMTMTIDPTRSITPTFGTNPNAVNLGAHPSVAVNTPPPIGLGDNADQEIVGYNVYRQLPAQTDFTLITPAPIPDTTYTDAGLTEIGVYHYFVTAIMADTTCETYSDTVPVDFHVGIRELNKGAVTIYPNPVTDIVNVKSDYTITSIEVLSYIGQTAYIKNGIDQKTMKVNVSALPAGVYFVKVTTVEGVRTEKITIIR